MPNHGQPRALLEQQKSDLRVGFLPFRVPHPRRCCEGGSFAAQINSKAANLCVFATGFSRQTPPILIGTRPKTENALSHCEFNAGIHSNRYRFAVFFSRFSARESAPDLLRLPIHGIASAIQTAENILTGRRQRVRGISLRRSQHSQFATGGLP
jgi:hypothetical protein